MLSHPILSYPIQSYPIISYPNTIFHHITSHPVQSNPIQSCHIQSYHIISYHTISSPLLSYQIISNSSYDLILSVPYYMNQSPPPHSHNLPGLCLAAYPPKGIRDYAGWGPSRTECQSEAPSWAVQRWDLHEDKLRLSRVGCR